MRGFLVSPHVSLSKNGPHPEIFAPTLTMKNRVRELTGRNSGRSLSSLVGDLRRFLVGWVGYFRIAEVRSPLHELDAWIRRRLRVVQLTVSSGAAVARCFGTCTPAASPSRSPPWSRVARAATGG